MLIGEYLHTVDEKNRVSLPIKFRKEMGQSVVIAPGLDSCLFVFAPNEWQAFSEKLALASVGQADTRSFNRYMLGGAHEVEVDASGRILIPDILKVKAGLGKTIAVVGVQSRVELWDSATWNTYKKGVEEQADQLAEKLGNVGVL